MAELSEFLYEIGEISGAVIFIDGTKIELRKKLYAINQEEQIEFVHGCGKRKTKLQGSIEKLVRTVVWKVGHSNNGWPLSD